MILLKASLTRIKGPIAFINDYAVWVSGPEIKSNIERLQADVIPKLEAWADSSGAIFNPKKTVLVHFTQNRKKLKK